MHEIKCPHCGKVFSVDDASYASVASQVRTHEFEEELRTRVMEVEKQQQLIRQSERLQDEQAFQRQLSAREKELEQRGADIARLEEQLKNLTAVKQAELQQQLAAKDAEIQRIQAQMMQDKSQVEVAVLKEQNKSSQALQMKEGEISALKERLEAEKSASLQREQELRQGYESKIREKQEMVEYYKDLKMRMSTKMVGETLEIHCSTLFNSTVRPIMPQAYFEKDNDASGGSKGDFIFRDYDDGFEYVSIMFEMKNEMDGTAAKHRNEDFLKKLDEDRRKKGCEYAVLVSLLEPDNETYNAGIIDVSYKYEKMYVIRPQFFIPLITLLVQTSRKSIDLQRQLAVAKSQTVDLSNFEGELNAFKDAFGRNYRLASEKFKTAIEEIDKSIAHLQKIKDSLIGSENNLRLANDKADALSVKRLTRKSPTLAQAFADAAKTESN